MKNLPRSKRFLKNNGLLVLGLFCCLAMCSTLPKAFATTYVNELKPFSTDGCSRFPDGIPFIKPTQWLKCCVAHDVAYWKGGTAEERQAADSALEMCVSRNGAPLIGFAMYTGVRMGGFEGFPLTWHWGYGWKIPRGYSTLRSEEQQIANTKLKPVLRHIDQLPLKAQSVIRHRESLSGNYCLDLAVVEIEKAIRAKLNITKLVEEDTTRLGVTQKTMVIHTDKCKQALRFQFYLWDKNSCTTPMDELTARYAIRPMGTNFAEAGCSP